MIDTPEPMLTSRQGNCAGVGFESNEIEYWGGFGEGRGRSSIEGVGDIGLGFG